MDHTAWKMINIAWIIKIMVWRLQTFQKQREKQATPTRRLPIFKEKSVRIKVAVELWFLERGTHCSTMISDAREVSLTSPEQ